MSEDILTEEEEIKVTLASTGEVVELKSMTPGEMIAELLEIRQERKRISDRDSILVDLWRDIELALMQTGDKMGMKRMSSTVATATITEETLPMVDDWDAVHQYILEHESPHLLQRRVSAAAYRELQDSGTDVPGISPYNKRKISLRKL